MKLSRRKFADRFGLDERALQDREQGRRVRDRAARVLLTVIDRDPDAVVWALGAQGHQFGRRADCNYAPARFRSLALLSWPQAAMMSRPRGVRTVQVRPPSRQIVIKARMRFSLEHS